MLEGLVAWVLNNYLGKYVENLNTDQLSVALLSGKVELENLPLKKDALRHLGLPVEVKAGFIGKVQLHVPVRQIRSAPWLIAIEKLYLVAAPVNLDEWDSNAEATYSHERKVALLDALEAQWRADHEASDGGYYATSYSSWLSYGTGLLANIVENLQLKLNDVHIRYEDALTCAPNAFACGLTVESLAAESCDSNWKRGFTLLTADNDGCSFKLLELQKLAVYWDPMQVPGGMLADCSISELTERMSQTWKVSHRYVVSPASATARVRRERTEQPLRSRTRPRIAAHLTLDTVLLNLSSRQYNEAVGCALGLEQVARLREFRVLRPAAPVRGHARHWWLYALRCHYPHHRWMDPKPTWESCLDASRKTRQYVEICLGMFSNPTATLPPDKKTAKDEYEWNTPLHLLKALREVAMRKVPKSSPVSTPDKPANSGRSMLVHWFPQWWGWYGAAGTAGTSGATGTPDAIGVEPLALSVQPAPTVPPARLEEEILDVLADSIENNTLLKRDTVFGKFDFTLNNGSLNLFMDYPEGDDKSSSVPGGLELQFSLVCLGVESRPRAGSHALHVSLGAVCLSEHLTPDTLFPVLVAPQGMIREGLSAMNSAASTMAWCQARAAPPLQQLHPLFQLTYEKKPSGLNCDYKLWVKSASLEVVYSGVAVAWASSFVCAPWRSAPRRQRAARAAAAVRTRTTAKLIDHIEHIMHPHLGERRTWHIELDISAPQILFVEDLCDRDASVLIVDFGRLRLANAQLAEEQHSLNTDDEEMFMTPCSTPPGSLLSPASPPASPPGPPPTQHVLDAANLHNKLYERYTIEFSDLQILVGRARDNWKYAHMKSTSSLHLLDRFSILLQAERRVVATSDPQYPLAALSGTLPALVVHLSEHKLAAVRALLLKHRHEFTDGANQEQSEEDEEDESSVGSETGPSEHSSMNNSSLYLLQFAIDQMSLEVQSRGRSIAEVQVCGVRLGVSARALELSLSLSVHSLLLVDALQTYGPDFELLVASHKHVGMDTASGSIRGSEPTSPTSPVSPTSPAAGARPPPAPHALRHALHSLYHSSQLYSAAEAERAKSPSWGFPSGGWGGADDGVVGGGGWGAAGAVDNEALIVLELSFVKGEAGTEDLRIVNILFNNLDIIANQETIVELIGFAQRVWGHAPPRRPTAPPAAESAAPADPAPVLDEHKKEVRTEITFDFHRLGVLLLRAALSDGALAAKKIATATVSEAHIQATVGSGRVEASGSLGGVQVVSLCGPAAARQPRVLAAGAPSDGCAALDKALLFDIARYVLPPSDDAHQPVVEASVNVRVASVWYTHSGALLLELQGCVAEFQQYLANLARSIRAAAADMAITLVHPRAESLYANPKLSQSMDGMGVSPRRRTVSLGCSLDDTNDIHTNNIVLSVCVELESPVVVLPRSASSAHVLVAHLGRMSLANRPGPPHKPHYNIRVRDISLVTLDVSEKLKRLNVNEASMEQIYDASCGKPVLHDTALQLTVSSAGDEQPQYLVSGQIVGGLHVSARREQYEQVLETLRGLAAPPQPTQPPHHNYAHDHHAHENVAAGAGLAEGLGAVPTLRLDPQLRAAVLAVPPPPLDSHQLQTHTHTPLKVEFSVGQFTVELRADLGTGERSLVQLAFREFTLLLDRVDPLNTTLLMSLHSITMEDLTKEPDSKHRMLMMSHTIRGAPKATFLSKSCPDLVWPRPSPRPAAPLVSPGSLHYARCAYTSLPSELNVIDRDVSIILERNKGNSKCGLTALSTPDESPGGALKGQCLEQHDAASSDALYDDDDCELSPDDNLVRISVHMRDPRHPDYEKHDKVSKLTKVDFNCLNLVVSVDSWVTVLDFFGIAGGEESPEVEREETDGHQQSTDGDVSGVSETKMSIRSLSVVLVGGAGEVCRALVSRVSVTVRTEPVATAASAARRVRGRLGALALSALAPHAPLWRERFRTHADQALTFAYTRLNAAEAAAAGYETSLSIEIGPATYVHTKRFVQDLQTFVNDFSLLRKVILQARRKVSVSVGASREQRQRLRVRCAAPVIVVPVSGRARAALVAQLDALTVHNCFKRAGDEGTISTLIDPQSKSREMLDVRSVVVERATLWCASGGRGLRVRRAGPPLLPRPATLHLQIEHNISDTHNVADMSVHGTLATLQCALDPQQYRVVRGVLAHNLGEPAPAPAPAPAEPHPQQQVWPTMSLRLDLHDVLVRLEAGHGAASLACINFIKSRLLLETYSDLSQDIDLVSQEILVSDTRYKQEPANRRGNVFSHIVQPMPDHPHSVQAEVHARRRGESSAYTIMINNMRLMAILDWWEAANQFILQPPPPAADRDQPTFEPSWAAPAQQAATRTEGAGSAEGRTELKLNITDSQIVLVEDASLWDTNAVILKSTTVIRYGCCEDERLVSCELNELEVFSCVLGLEEETALAIVDPAALTVALHRDRRLHVDAGSLSLRLSYHDMRMFAAMLRSLPVQAQAALAGAGMSEAAEDAPANLRRAPRPAPRPAAPPVPARPHMWPLAAVQVRAACVSLCVIDDCLDSDVPLLDLTLTDLTVEQDLREVEAALPEPAVVGGEGAEGVGAGAGRLSALLSVDYYNRTLSGWEPVVEPWRFETRWERTLSSSLRLARLQLAVSSADMLDTNITSSLIELYQLVRANWTADYYAPQGSCSAEQSPKGSPAGHRRRSPFVPYALRNHTGHRLWFTTVLTSTHSFTESCSYGPPDDGWVCVRAGDTEPFSFGLRRGRGGAGGTGGAGGAGAAGGSGARGPHVLHQLAIALDGWASPDPICVDKVGVFFRSLTHTKTGVEAWLVLEVSLEGSARKLVTARSALQVLNRLPHAVELRVEHGHAHQGACMVGGVCEAETDASPGVHAGARWAALGRSRAARGASLVRVPHDTRHAHYIPFVTCAQWSSGGGGGGGSGASAGRAATVGAGCWWAAPLSASPGRVWARPLRTPGSLPPPGSLVQSAPAPLDWRRATTEPLLIHAECRAPPDHVYRFCCAIIRERFPVDRAVGAAAHTLRLVPALQLLNLLPIELHFRAGADDTPSLAAGTLPPGDTKPFHEVNIEEGVELCVKLEGFSWSSALSVGGAGGAGAAGGAAFTARLKLRDTRDRRLYLNAAVAVHKTDGIKVSISAPYWLVNRSGLPLVFRAEGAGAGEAAGQWEEHELARCVAPLLFSFNAADAGPTLAVRLGNALPGTPEWCSPFGLGPGTTVKKLEVRGDGAGGDRVFALGVAVRAGRGRYRRTTIVTFTPRYQLHNNTSHHLQFAQKCTATTLNDPGALATHVSAVAGCYLPWHWPRWDRERLLCVRILADSSAQTATPPAPRTTWSGGFKIDNTRSLHLACRELSGGWTFVRVEVACQGATLFVVLTDAECGPPPLRVENRSAVAVMVAQSGSGGEECVVGAHAALRWALPEPDAAPALALRAPGGPRTTLHLQHADNTMHHLHYQNFIYVVFTASATLHSYSNTREEGKPSACSDEGVLVLEVPLGSTRVVLGRKRYGDRSQLWRRGPGEQLIHEGSSPPQPTDAYLAEDAPLSPHAMVLDIEGAAPRPSRAAALVLRRADGRRASTQAWRLHRGRMLCAHNNLAVQPDGGLMALMPGSRVVLALVEREAGVGAAVGAGEVPAEQRVAWHTLRPGSGTLTVALHADGPTRVVRIYDHKAPESGWVEGGESEDEEESGGGTEWGVVVGVAGVSVSLVARAPAAELLHARLQHVRLELGHDGRAARLALAVRELQCDNQLLGTPSPVLLHTLPDRGAASADMPALHAALELMHSPAKKYNAYFFRHFIVALRPVAVRLEERLMLKLWLWAWPDEEEGVREEPDETECEARRMLDDLTALHATRYYFALFKIIPSQIRLSMCTANKLEGELAALKRRLGLTLIRFEDAAVELEPFVRAHHYDTTAQLARQIYAHFKDELKWQAAKILGSVDFLGNPLGFVADVSEGVSGLLLEGNVGALLKNVTHGISNSAAKVTESLGDGLERVVSDEAHEETRRRIRSTNSGAHLAAGLRSLTLGILGGMTSLVKHSYEGAASEGLPGFLTGVGKGLVGTVTKPVIGVLDLATETASALRDSSRRPDRFAPQRARRPRCAAGPAGLLTRYCPEQAEGAALLYQVNGADYSESFVAYRAVRDAPHDIRALLSTRALRIVTCKHAAPQVVMETPLGALVGVRADDAHCVELSVRGGGGGAGGGAGEALRLRRPRVQCDDAERARWLATHAALARQLYHDFVHTLHQHNHNV